MYPERKLRHLLLCCTLAAAVGTQAIEVPELRLSTHFATVQPLQTDTADALGKKFSVDDLLMDTPLPLDAWQSGQTLSDSLLPAPEVDGLLLAGFQVENRMFAKCHIKVRTTAKPFAVYVDGKKADHADLLPGRHDVVVKLLRRKEKADTLNVSLSSEQEKYLSVNPTGKRFFTLEDYLHGPQAGRPSLSRSGRFVRYSVSTSQPGGNKDTRTVIRDLKTGVEHTADGFVQWAEESDRFVRSRKDNRGRVVYQYVDPETGQAEVFFTDATNSEGRFFAGERYMLISKQTDGPKEDPKVFQVLEPDDRIPGWRNRRNVSLMDTRTGLVQPLTQGQHNVYAVPSMDGQRIVLGISENDVTQRPFSFTTYLLLDPATMQADTLVRRDGFVGSVQWSADGEWLVFSGSPEAFGGIGINDPTGKTPSMIQTELFRMDLKTREVKSITRDFYPNVQDWRVHRDGNVYALCEDHDCKRIFRYDSKKSQWERLPLTEQVIGGFSLATDKPLLAYVGQSDSNSDRLYVYDLKTRRETCLLDLDKGRMEDIELGPCREWNFQSSRGDTICGRYYLPPAFDETKQYPMLVYYYGGCSPVSRKLDSYYNFHNWAAMGYVVYVLQPSGCTGFGQEFAARHVNAYGDYTADDIIEGTRRFCDEHPYVNRQKIGCLGASYGGFMTMYLQTKTDIFAAAMAHAGISNPASYWGFGYWGYSYNAVAAADSYPWNNPELYSGHAPLFHADKIHTPILFLHGSADTNVPIVESTQLFNALKILGRECAFVTVEGQNHHILDYEKHIKWTHTFYAWFAKYLQDDSTWWDTLYPPKNLK